MMTLRPHPRLDSERGSVSLWAVLVAFCLTVIVGIAVDFSGQAVAEQRARSIAFEAARTGGQQVNLDQVIRGGQTRTDPDRKGNVCPILITAPGSSPRCSSTGGAGAA